MDIANDLALIDLLCTRDFPAARTGPDEDTGGPGYHMAGLGQRDWPDADDCYAYEAAVTERLTTRWGEPSRWGTVTLAERIARGEHIPEPWSRLSALAVELRTWEASDTGRWVTVAVADHDAEEQPHVFVVVTNTAPA
ncbi:hypothetical protein [Streptomyces dysideae]|uniref:Uncharacterized protein n=1 Tax=Streptomyces dysideae TaxID=909626 RepID=A0A101UUM3_9ACTN|nr:hypothetical protein [Streptomyces dysideae]KUO17154.1 hypothetical protein AQJ91_31800 [Streptomyces dysideae]